MFSSYKKICHILGRRMKSFFSWVISSSHVLFKTCLRKMKQSHNNRRGHWLHFPQVCPFQRLVVIFLLLHSKTICSFNSGLCGYTFVTSCKSTTKDFTITIPSMHDSELISQPLLCIIIVRLFLYSEVSLPVQLSSDKGYTCMVTSFVLTYWPRLISVKQETLVWRDNRIRQRK